MQWPDEISNMVKDVFSNDEFKVYGQLATVDEVGQSSVRTVHIHSWLESSRKKVAKVGSDNAPQGSFRGIGEVKKMKQDFGDDQYMLKNSYPLKAFSVFFRELQHSHRNDF
jgi:hypothetical protein